MLTLRRLTPASEGPIVFGMSAASNPLPSITRVRHEAKRRNLTVTRLERLAPRVAARRPIDRSDSMISDDLIAHPPVHNSCKECTRRFAYQNQT